MRRSAAIAVTALVLVCVACSGGAEPVQGTPTGAEPDAETIEVLMDAPSPAGEQLTFTSYFPATVTAHGGDTITFSNESDLGVPHTVTFGVAGDRSNLPAVSPPDDPDADNPVVAGACFTPDPPTVDLTECAEAAPSSLGLSPYAGTGYWNSGAAGITLILDPSIPLGSYPFLCAYHENMTGLLEVVDPAVEAPSADEVRAAAGEAQAASLELGDQGVALPPVDVDRGDVAVVAGWGSGAVLVQRFEPARVEVEAGTTVSWVSPVYVHTVSVAVLIDGEVPESGVIGPFRELRSDRFSVTFTEPGSYPYLCTFHDGMEGEVVVV